MVIVRLIGGLANQMFPYATARRIAHALDTELKLDISGFSIYGQRDDLEFRRYSLGVFNIQENFATEEEIRRLTVAQKGWMRKLLKKKARRPPSYIKEKQYHFDPSIMDLQGDIYLAGNWNSSRYFEDIDFILWREFTFKEEPTGKNRECLDKIKDFESVSIHVRRGDYVTNAKVNQVHGICDLDYYKKSIAAVAERVENPHFFIFSDDVAWTRKNLIIDFPYTIVDHNTTLAGHEDMRLMSQCKHNIIANSGFSWWAAWLNKNPDKLVIAPQKWFNTEKYDTSSLIPAAWHRV